MLDRSRVVGILLITLVSILATEVRGQSSPRRVIYLEISADARARVGAQQLAKQTVQRNIASRLQAFATPAKVGALEGGVFSGLDDYGRQTRDITVGLQEAVEIDKTRLLTSIGAGATIGAGLGKLIDVGMSKLDKKLGESKIL